MNANKHFSPDQVRSFVRDAKSAVGHGWNLFGQQIQRALIAEKALQVLRGQHAGAMTTEAMDELYFAMLEEAKIEC